MMIDVLNTRGYMQLRYQLMILRARNLAGHTKLFRSGLKNLSTKVEWEGEQG